MTQKTMKDKENSTRSRKGVNKVAEKKAAKETGHIDVPKEP
jgi:hypothetical protein